MDISYNDVFRRLASEMGAEFVDGGLLGLPKVRARVRNWTVTLDYTQPESRISKPSFRIRAPLRTGDGFRFIAYHKGFLSTPRSSMQDVKLGEQEVDGDFGVKATDETKAHALLADPKVRQLIQTLSSVDSLSVTSKDHLGGSSLPDGVYILWFYRRKYTGDTGEIKSLFELFAATLDRLCAIGAASTEAPGYEL
jgi:hypothetical protein